MRPRFLSAAYLMCAYEYFWICVSAPLMRWYCYFACIQEMIQQLCAQSRTNQAVQRLFNLLPIQPARSSNASLSSNIYCSNVFISSCPRRNFWLGGMNDGSPAETVCFSWWCGDELAALELFNFWALGEHVRHSALLSRSRCCVRGTSWFL